MRPIAVLRPEPANSKTAAAIEAVGGTAIRLPLFETRALDWTPPASDRFDALVITSANTLLRGGPALDHYQQLPTYAVGAASAAAARRAGFTVVGEGKSDAVELLSILEARGVQRALHLGGRERKIRPGGVISESIPVYASEILPLPPVSGAPLVGSVALLHSPRAAKRLAEVVDTDLRATIALVAISQAAASAAGMGWQNIAITTSTEDQAMVDLAFAHAIDPAYTKGEKET